MEIALFSYLSIGLIASGYTIYLDWFSSKSPFDKLMLSDVLGYFFCVLLWPLMIIGSYDFDFTIWRRKD